MEALPHKASVDDEFGGYRILKDTTVLANVWFVPSTIAPSIKFILMITLCRAVFHDPQIYPEPFTFNPSRFLSPSIPSPKATCNVQPDPRRFAFGFGARVCPGHQFAEKSLLLCMYATLARSTVTLADPLASLPVVDFTTGHTRCVFDSHWIDCSAN